MIGPGWLPRPINRLRRRTLAYTRVRRRAQARAKNRDRSGEAMHHEIVIFDRGPAEFPVATVVPHDPRSRARVLVADLGRWLAARWTWFRPRMVPVVVAALGAFFVIASAEYLSHAHGSGSSQPPALTSTMIISAP